MCKNRWQLTYSSEQTLNCGFVLITLQFDRVQYWHQGIIKCLEKERKSLKHCRNFILNR